MSSARDMSVPDAPGTPAWGDMELAASKDMDDAVEAEMLARAPTNEHVSEEADRVVEEVSTRMSEELAGLRKELVEMRKELADSRPKKKARVEKAREEKPVMTAEQISAYKEQLKAGVKKEKDHFVKLDAEVKSLDEYKHMVEHMEGLGEELHSMTRQMKCCLPMKGDLEKLKELEKKVVAKVESAKFKKCYEGALKKISKLGLEKLEDN